ncbi:hypothetical protein IFM89_019274 [Coptis chinensis]|uniref:Uncharacterized protein n=1 Tax=Coptis chinensis TaxID=261450 RepID=A0A835H3X5_9MAGN|nr:hypothetical protein IFM89_019274 [Coptis chinensis]
MSKFSIVAFQAAETAPPRVISIERRTSYINRLETIHEEGDVPNHNGKPPCLEAATSDFAKRRPSVLAG